MLSWLLSRQAIYKLKLCSFREQQERGKKRTDYEINLETKDILENKS